MNGQKPIVKYFKMFGCEAYAYMPEKLRKKFYRKILKCIFISYSEKSKGYKPYDPK